MTLPEEPTPGGELAAAREPLGESEAERVQLLAAALRADMSDLAIYERLLTNSIADVLPAGVIEIERQRSVGDRLAGRAGEVVAIRIQLGEQNLELVRHRGRLEAFVTRNVRGVAISHKEVGLEEWSAALAQALARFAENNAKARAALQRLLGA